MITISEATPNDFKIIQEIAHKSWPVAYGKILYKSQIDFMLESMYGLEVLNDNYTKKNHLFLLINEFENPLGFASYEHHYLNTNTTRLHKLYLLPEAKGRGLGKLLLEKIIKIAYDNKSEIISLNVNKFNNAHLFYQKMGFEIVAVEDLEIGHGYLMEDNKMELKL